MSTLDVSVLLRLIDGVSGPGKQAAEALRSVVKAANDLKKVTGADGLTKDLKASQATIRAMSSDVRQFSSAFRSAMDSARGLTKEFGGGKGMFAADVRNMQQMAKLQQQMMREQARLGSGGGRRNAHGMPLIGLGFGHPHAREWSRKTYESTAGLDTERHLMNAAGFGAADREKLMKAARDTAADVPISTESMNLRRVRELNYALGNRIEMATEALPEVAKLMGVIKFAKGAEKAGAVEDQIMESVKGAELKNYIEDMPTFKRWLKFQGQSVIATGGLVQPNSMFQTMKYARSAVHGWDESFFPIVSEITQELATGKSGSRGGAGPSLANFKRMFVDSTFAAKFIPDLLKRGLVDPNAVVYNDKGKPDHVKAGGFYGSELAAKNPFEYMLKHILPSMQKDGVDLHDHAAIVKWIAGLGGTDVMKQLMALMVIQRDQIKARLDLYKQVGDVDKLYAESMRTLQTNVDALAKQTSDMSASIFAPMAPMGNRILKGMTSIATQISQWAKRNGKMIEEWTPTALFGAGAGGLMLLRMMGLRALLPLLGGGAGLMAGGPMGMLAGTMLMKSLFGGGAGAAGAAGAVAGRSLVGAFMSGVAGAFSLAGIGLLIAKMIDTAFGKTIDAQTGRPKVTGDIVHDAYSIAKGLKNAAVWNIGTNPVPFTSGVNVWGESESSGSLRNIGGSAFQNTPNGLNPQGGSAAGGAWGTSFIDMVKSIVSGATVEGPNIPLPAVRSGGVGHAALRGGNTVHVTVNNTVHGATDPRAVVHAISAHFNSAVGRHLSDGAFA